MTITALPTPVPTRNDPLNFSARADAFLAALPDFATEANALATEVNGYEAAALSSKNDAATSETNALAYKNAADASAQSAATAAGATLWVSGGNYSPGMVRYSPANFYVYRCTTTRNGSTTDPSADPSYWSLAGTAMPQMVIETSVAITMTANMHVVLTNAAASKATLPPSPAAGDVCAVTVANGLATNSIGYNAGGAARTIMGAAEDLLLDSQYCTVWMRYVEPTLGWRVV